MEICPTTLLKMFFRSEAYPESYFNFRGTPQSVQAFFKYATGPRPRKRGSPIRLSPAT